MSDDITGWIANAQNSDEQAAAAIWDAYFQKLVSYARTKLSAMPKRAVDEEDVVLSAMNSFFRGAQKGRFDPKDRDELWNLLATITALRRGPGINVTGDDAIRLIIETPEGRTDRVVQPGGRPHLKLVRVVAVEWQTAASTQLFRGRSDQLPTIPFFDADEASL